MAASRPSMSSPTGGGWAARLFGRPDAVVSSGEDMLNRMRAVEDTQTQVPMMSQDGWKN